MKGNKCFHRMYRIFDKCCRQSFIIIARPKYFTSNASYDLWHRVAWQQVDKNSRWMQNMKDRWKVRGIRQCSPPCQWTQMRLTPAAWEGNLSDISCLCICCDKYISPKQGDVAAMEVKEKTMELLCRLLVHVEGWTGVAVGKVGILWSLGLSAQEEAWTWVMFGTNYELCWFFFFCWNLGFGVYQWISHHPVQIQHWCNSGLEILDSCKTNHENEDRSSMISMRDSFQKEPWHVNIFSEFFFPWTHTIFEVSRRPSGTLKTGQSPIS